MARGRVSFDQNRCKGCELCTTVCPVNIVIMDRSKINKKGYNPATVSEEEKCVGCGNCAMMCPDLVITVERD
ncbi:2-oxoglutarate ferredoxin oxidoreductase subunit delta [Alkalithermobacter thermoalcaliphilus JW-YL-7 = DSM 7308]|uniref:2-oxoglutarate ferredoxin oxidoreductase subunit delta n=1 Tax=Alkalithermobacter thermoalcaliphilus JW-YL-7 = DSM 7308 TaxID=1121328 RepID=A0A150FN57_CLOPD|nr:4Fe-4S ferredoxin, iron-sulpur binding domain-containing protein [[Clostridium] paradoxum JW-YL-7 = DSM 7308]SHL36198.1 2-oxoglutarate ferredoxin oxidoreductase subunit delta [[Clostridium] paradoxum JW-YL-7 = DSM 7308]